MSRVAPAPFVGANGISVAHGVAVSEEKNNNYVEVVIDARDDLVEPTLDDAPARLPANGVPATLTIENHRLLSSNHEHPVSLCGKWGKQKGHCNSVQ